MCKRTVQSLALNRTIASACYLGGFSRQNSERSVCEFRTRKPEDVAFAVYGLAVIIGLGTFKIDRFVANRAIDFWLR